MKIVIGQRKKDNGKKKIEKKLRKINRKKIRNMMKIVIGPKRKENGELKIEQLLLVEILKIQWLDLLLVRM